MRARGAREQGEQVSKGSKTREGGQEEHAELRGVSLKLGELV